MGVTREGAHFLKPGQANGLGSILCDDALEALMMQDDGDASVCQSATECFAQVCNLQQQAQQRRDRSDKYDDQQKTCDLGGHL